MKVLTLAAGAAVGYVLGTRAGRERYEQIVEGARKLTGSPAAVQAQTTTKKLVEAGTDAVTAKLAPTASTDAVPRQPVGAPRPPRRSAGAIAPVAIREPQV